MKDTHETKPTTDNQEKDTNVQKDPRHDSYTMETEFLLNSDDEISVPVVKTTAKEKHTITLRTAFLHIIKGTT